MYAPCALPSARTRTYTVPVTAPGVLTVCGVLPDALAIVAPELSSRATSSTALVSNVSVAVTTPLTPAIAK